MTDIATYTDVTIARYDADAEPFFAATVAVDISPLYVPFLAKLAPDAAILDAGCGSGRDALAFREQGYAVTAIEPSPPLARLAEMHTGLPVEVKRFQAIDWCERFDGIWACASLLHVSLAELPAVLQRLARALRPEGVLYVSFKYGHGERDSGGRHFTDLNETALAELLDSVPELTLMETWTTADRRSWREAEQWLNALLRLTPPGRQTTRSLPMLPIALRRPELHRMPRDLAHSTPHLRRDGALVSAANRRPDPRPQ